MPNSPANQDNLQPHLDPGAGAESGSNRSSEHYQRAPGHHTTLPEQTAHVGQTITRTPADSSQGIANRSLAEEDERQQGVVEHRPDAQAGLNSNARRETNSGQDARNPVRRAS